MTISTTTHLPADPGSYILRMYVDAPLTVHPGKLGAVDLVAGDYVYCGSALGPGGLRARVGRHLRQDKRPHWHIDALTTAVPIVEVWLTASRERLECRWTKALRTLPSVTAPAPGFGASDCRCVSHLLHVPDRDTALQAVCAVAPVMIVVP